VLVIMVVDQELRGFVVSFKAISCAIGASFWLYPHPQPFSLGEKGARTKTCFWPLSLSGKAKAPLALIAPLSFWERGAGQWSGDVEYEVLHFNLAPDFCPLLP